MLGLLVLAESAPAELASDAGLLEATPLGLREVGVEVVDPDGSVAQPVAVPLFLLAFVILQGLFGALTVTWKLKPLIVTLHLLGGFTTLAILWWVCLRPAYRELHPRELVLRRLAAVALATLIVQIALGGWTSSNYAAIACPDVPTCQNSWWPPMDFSEAFVLWRGVGIDYEGGVLDQAARVAIHMRDRKSVV